MIRPTVDQTEGIWITRTNDQGYHSVQEVFPKETEIDEAHRANCRLLIQRGSLQLEDDGLLPRARRRERATERYCRKHVEQRSTFF